MTGTRHNILSGLTAEQVSTRVLVALVVLAVVVFGAFFLIGYDVPFEDNPEFNAPRLTDLVLVFIYVLVLLAAILAVTAIAISLKARDKAQGKANNIPAAKIAWGTAGLLVASLLATFLLGSAEPVQVNSVAYTDVFWLKATDMFINTSLVLLLVAVCGVAFGLSGYCRKMGIRK